MVCHYLGSLYPPALPWSIIVLVLPWTSRASGYASALHPFSSIGLLLPSGSSFVLAPSDVPPVFRVPYLYLGPTGERHSLGLPNLRCHSRSSSSQLRLGLHLLRLRIRQSVPWCCLDPSPMLHTCSSLCCLLLGVSLYRLLQVPIRTSCLPTS